jgi:hypothetical protein
MTSRKEKKGKSKEDKGKTTTKAIILNYRNISISYKSGFLLNGEELEKN